MQILNFTHSTVLCAIYHDEMDIMQQATTKILIRMWINKTFWPKVAFPSGGHLSKQEILSCPKALAGLTGLSSIPAYSAN